MNVAVFLRIIVLGAPCLLCGCEIAGGISTSKSERWLSNFMSHDQAHNVCWHEPVDPDVLASLYEAWYVNDDIAYIILTHPSFPRKTKAEIIKRGDISDYYFKNAICAGKYTREDLMSYLHFASQTWFSLCAPLYDLMLVKGETADYYAKVWSLYKEKRERFPLWGYVFPFWKVKDLGIKIRKYELENIMENDDVPAIIKEEIAVQLERNRE